MHALTKSPEKYAKNSGKTPPLLILTTPTAQTLRLHKFSLNYFVCSTTKVHNESSPQKNCTSVSTVRPIFFFPLQLGSSALFSPISNMCWNVSSDFSITMNFWICCGSNVISIYIVRCNSLRSLHKVMIIPWCWITDNNIWNFVHNIRGAGVI